MTIKEKIIQREQRQNLKLKQTNNKQTKTKKTKKTITQCPHILVKRFFFLWSHVSLYHQPAI